VVKVIAGAFILDALVMVLQFDVGLIYFQTGLVGDQAPGDFDEVGGGCLAGKLVGACFDFFLKNQRAFIQNVVCQGVFGQIRLPQEKGDRAATFEQEALNSHSV